MAERIARFGVSLDADLLRRFDELIQLRHYSNRSEAIRDLIRRDLVEETWGRGEGDVIGTVTIVYDHHQRDLTDKLIEIQHGHFINTLCTTHVHLDHHSCLEVIILRGRPPEIEKMSIRLGGLKGVQFAKLTRTSSMGT